MDSPSPFFGFCNKFQNRIGGGAIQTQRGSDFEWKVLALSKFANAPSQQFPCIILSF
jgi:hypothetical protein